MLPPAAFSPCFRFQGLAIRRACYSVLRYITENGAKGAQVHSAAPTSDSKACGFHASPPSSHMHATGHCQGQGPRPACQGHAQRHLLLKYCAHASCSHWGATASTLLPFLQSACGCTAIRLRRCRARYLSCMLTSAPAPTSSCTTSKQPFITAKCRGEQPCLRRHNDRGAWPNVSRKFKAANTHARAPSHLFCAFASAPARTSSRATCRRPSSAEKSPQCSGKRV
jgi:hypothetical protein